MATEVEITLPDEVPAMTLPGVAFFPQALMPLHVFEPRYREMLAEVLRTNRLMVVAGTDCRPGLAAETPRRVASVGIVRACQGNADGTSDLLIQGLCRVAITGIVRDEPYRCIRIKPLASEPGAENAENARSRNELARLLRLKLKLSTGSEGRMTAFLKAIEDPETFVDVAAFSLCDNDGVKQRLLETLDVHRRLKLYAHRLRVEIEGLRLRRILQVGVVDERIDEN
ncbi:MAG: LON peptidase substrate-binding domain-containing protein [Opitutaceae bacterium]